MLDYPMWPLVRRLRSLRALGITANEMAAETGLPAEWVNIVIDFDLERASGELNETVRDYYTAHQRDVYRPSEADELLPWPVPMDWDNIDNRLIHATASRHVTRAPKLDKPKLEHGVWKNRFNLTNCARGHTFYPWNIIRRSPTTLECRSCREGRDRVKHGYATCIEFAIEQAWKKKVAHAQRQSA